MNFNLGQNTEPRDLFCKDLLAQLRQWLQQGDNIVLFMALNEHVLTGKLARGLIELGLIECSHNHWGKTPPNTFIDGKIPIDGA